MNRKDWIHNKTRSKSSTTFRTYWLGVSSSYSKFVKVKKNNFVPEALYKNKISYLNLLGSSPFSSDARFQAWYMQYFEFSGRPEEKWWESVGAHNSEAFCLVESKVRRYYTVNSRRSLQCTTASGSNRETQKLLH